MALASVRCPYCGSDQVCKHGQNKQGMQRYRCQNTACQRSTFLQEYANQACHPGMKERIIDMALNGSGIRDTARVLGVSPVTVIETLKKRIRTEISQYQYLESIRQPHQTPGKTHQIALLSQSFSKNYAL